MILLQVSNIKLNIDQNEQDAYKKALSFRTGSQAMENNKIFCGCQK